MHSIEVSGRIVLTQKETMRHDPKLLPNPSCILSLFKTTAILGTQATEETLLMRLLHTNALKSELREIGLPTRTANRLYS